MKSFHLSLVAAALVAVGGCTQGTSGGPGVTDTKNTTTVQRPDYGQAEETFTLSMPVLATHLKQGESVHASIGISRGKNFDEDVTLSFDEIPVGVTISPATAVIKHGDATAKVDLQAADDAALGNFTVKVMGHPTKGADAMSTFKLAVDAK